MKLGKPFIYFTHALLFCTIDLGLFTVIVIKSNFIFLDVMFSLDAPGLYYLLVIPFNLVLIVIGVRVALFVHRKLIKILNIE